MLAKRSGVLGRRTKKAGMSIWRLQALFRNFKAILELNNTALARMAEMEQALGGEYIFDRPYLEDSVRDMASLVHHTIYCLNALTGNAYVPLYDRYQDILAVLDAILADSRSDYDREPVLLLDRVGWELEPQVGIEAVCLAELGRHAGVRVVRGAVVTMSGVDALLGRTGDGYGPSSEETTAALERALAALDGESGKLRIVGVRAGGEFVETLEELPGDLFSVNADIGLSGEGADDEGRLRTAGLELAERIRSVAAGCGKGTAVLILATPPAAVCGMVRTRIADESGVLVIETRERQTVSDGDTFFLRRVHPFDMVRSRIAPKQGGRRFADGRRATDAVSGTLGRGSALVALPNLKSLAETAMALERMLGAPVEASWDAPDGAGCVITRVRPLSLQVEAPSGEDLAVELAGAEVLARGGQLVQSGVAAGLAVLVREDMRPEDFPLGAVAVAKTASPRLTPILRMASAVVTEYGAAAGHLATVARELRLPAVFGLAGATRLIPDGQNVTVDAGDGVVYAGVLDNLLRYGAAGGELYPTDPEYRALRRLLRFIMPLHLVNPDAPGFTIQGCRTLHDILHFCHDRAVDELAHFQDRRPGLGAIRSRRLRLEVPLDVRILDVGGGVDPETGDEAVEENVRSEPLSIFLQGLLHPSAWSTEASSLSFGDVMGNAPRTMRMLEAGAEAQGASLAIVGSDYLNLSLRMGYHFSVVDVFLGPQQSRNYVYFRFAGGLAAGKRRERRARLIERILESMDFMVTRESDLVVGRLKPDDDRAIRAAVAVLGSLTAYFRQLDTVMRDDADVDRISDVFSSSFMQAFVTHGDTAGGVSAVSGRE